MARPLKKGLDYFSFDVDFFDNEQMVAIAGEFGIKGEIVAVKLLCAVYRNGYFLEWSELQQMMLLKNLPGISADLLNQIVKRLVLWGFFDQSLFDSAGILTSKEIQHRFFNGTKRRIVSGETPFLLIGTHKKQSFCMQKPQKNGVSAYNNPINVYNNRVSAYRNPQKTEFLHTETPNGDEINKEKKVTKEKKYIKKISTDVDIKESSPSSSTIKQEVEFLKGEEIWLSNLHVLHRLDVNALKNRLDDFVVQCIADGKTSHASIQDAKQHFNSWLRIKLNSNNYANIQQQQNQRRRSSEITATSAEDYKTPF